MLVQSVRKTVTVRIATALCVLLALFVSKALAVEIAPNASSGTILFVFRITIGLVIVGILSLCVINPITRREIRKAKAANNFPQPTSG